MWRPGTSSPAENDAGAALLVVIMALALLLALGSALVLTTTIETRVWSRYRASLEARYAAEAALARALVDLEREGDWGPLPAGGTYSTFTDGPPAGVRPLPGGGGSIDLTGLTHQVQCGRRAPCSAADIARATASRPWGRNNPHWQLYAWGPLSALLPAASPFALQYVVVWIGDDPAETDDDPLIDGGLSASGASDPNPGTHVLSLLVHAYGPFGAPQALLVNVRRIPTGLQIDHVQP